MLTLPFLVVFFSVLFSGFFSGVEIAYFSLDQIKIKSLVKQKKRNAQLVASLKKNPDRLLTTILIGNNLVNIGASALLTYLMTELYGSQGVAIATGVMTFAILTFGEIVPKSIATRYAPFIALRSARLLFLLQIILFPFVWIFEQFSKIPRFFLKGGGQHYKITDDDVASMAAISYDQGELLDYERDAITNVLTLNDTQLKQIMTPIQSVVSTLEDTTLDEVVKTLRSTHFSRIPVYSSDLKTIKSFIFLKDILYQQRSAWSSMTAKEIARPALQAKDTDLVHIVYKKLLHNRTHLVVVIGRSNRVVGIVTLEDIIEEVLGEIYDETD